MTEKAQCTGLLKSADTDNIKKVTKDKKKCRTVKEKYIKEKEINQVQKQKQSV